MRPRGSALHLVLLGDSIFDNGAYTRGEPDVVGHLRRLMPSPWRATLCAVDGATTRRLAAQIPRIPQDATCLAVSIGGNDALGHSELLSTRVSSTAEALDRFSEAVAGFESSYRAALDAVLQLGLPTLVCTIYNGALSDPDDARRARVALAMFNDAIVRAAWERGCTVLDLRRVCVDPGDYANPIEPSGRGGARIADALARAVGAVPGGASAAYAPHCPGV